MTKIKFCGLSRFCDIEFANELEPEYVGFVFFKKSKRYVNEKKAAELKRLLKPSIKAVGVFVGAAPEFVAELLNRGDIDLAQLHGNEDEMYIKKLRELTKKPIIKAFQIESKYDAELAENSSADYILLDSGAGTGKTFDWDLILNIKRKYFLAGGLDANNAAQAIRVLKPYALDVSSGIETNGIKNKEKMTAFALAVGKEINI